jgi:hypothetical protein
MLIYHLGDEQLVLWWSQFKDVVSPHQHDYDYDDDDDNNNNKISGNNTRTTLNRFFTKNCHTRNITHHKESPTS